MKQRPKIAAMGSPIHSKKLFNEGLAVERGEIGFFFSRANEASGNTEFLLNGHGHTALAAPIEFGEDDTSEPDGFVEFCRLNQRIRSRSRIEDDPLFLWCIRVVLVQRAGDLGEFLHEVAFRVEASCGIANEKLDIAAVCAIPRIVAEGR